MKTANFAVKYPGTTTLVIAASQRQSSLLFEKIRGEVDGLIDQKKLQYSEPPTLTRIKVFTPGHPKKISTIYALPAGRTGYFIRGFTIDFLVADEAAYIPEEVWKAVIPMIAVSKKTRGYGWVILLSTPFGKGGYYYESFLDADFKSWHISSENCPRIPKDFLAKERKRLTKAEYAQEYLGEFMDEWNQFFPTTLIKERMKFIEWSLTRDYNPICSYYLGLDIARYGGDENAFVVAELDRKNKIKIVKVITTDRVSITDTIGRALSLHKEFNFRKLFVDDAGVGGGATDILIEKLGRRVVGINNAKRSIDKDARMKKIMKEDLYSHSLVMMEAGKVDMISDLKLLKSLKSVQFEYTADKNIKLFGKYTHVAEAFVRACWCIKERGLKVFIA